MNITSLSQSSLSPSSSSSSSSSASSLSRHHHIIQPPIAKQCRKSQSTSRLASWFSWSIPKRKNPAVAPFILQRKKSTNQNISDAIVNNATTSSTLSFQTQQKYQLSSHTHRQQPYYPQQSHHSKRPQKPQELHIQQHHRHDHVKRVTTRPHQPFQQEGQPSHHSLKSSSSLASSRSTSTSHSILSKPSHTQIDGNSSYRRSISFMLSRLGNKVRKVIQNGSQRIQPQLKSVNSSITMSLSSSLQNNLKEPCRPLPSSYSTSRNLCSQKIQTSTERTVLTKIESTGNTEPNETVHAMKNESNLLHVTDDEYTQPTTGTKDNDTAHFYHHSQQYVSSEEDCSWNDTRHSLEKSPATTQRLENRIDSNLSPLSTTEGRQLVFDATCQETEDENEDDGNEKRNLDSSNRRHSISTNNKSYYVYDSQDNDDGDDDQLNLKTPWSPPESLARRTMKSSKTDTNMKSGLSVPFIKMGLGRRSLDMEDQVQYTSRSISSTSFALQWQEKFHDQQLPRDRIVNTLKSVSLSLHNIIQHNHNYQQFTSDTTYVAHPNLLPGENARQLFATVPLTHWRDIFDQMAYIFDNGALTAEHAIITLIYIERMLGRSKQHLCEANWRLIVLAGLMAAVKVWDDCAVYNMDFVQIFPELDIKHINLIERRFLEHIDWDVSVRCSLFASTYFDLRSHI
ncbi:unnamed protein product [Absidia cylindrospora]